MLKKFLIFMLLISFQIKPITTSSEEIEFFSNITEHPEKEIISRKKCKKCGKFCNIFVANCGRIGALQVVGNAVIGGTLTVGGISFNSLIGVDGAAGLPGAQGIAGEAGIPGAIGLTGPTGATGADGASGLGLTTFGNFYALMPGDNADTVAPGTAVDFPQDGPSSGLIRSSASEFVLPAIGTYEIGWQVSVSEPGQLVLALNSVELAQTVVGRATGSSQIVGNTLITTTAVNSILSVRNPTGNAAALTITPIAGGTHPVSATLTIKRIS